jgi:hypothetical protein
MKRYLPLNAQTFSTILPIVSVAGIDWSGKPEANVAWKLLKKDPP